MIIAQVAWNQESAKPSKYLGSRKGIAAGVALVRSSKGSPGLFAAPDSLPVRVSLLKCWRRWNGRWLVANSIASAHDTDLHLLHSQLLTGQETRASSEPPTREWGSQPALKALACVWLAGPMCARRSAAQLWTSRCRFWASELLILDLASAALCAPSFIAVSQTWKTSRPLTLSRFATWRTLGTRQIAER